MTTRPYDDPHARLLSTAEREVWMLTVNPELPARLRENWDPEQPPRRHRIRGWVRNRAAWCRAHRWWLIGFVAAVGVTDIIVGVVG